MRGTVDVHIQQVPSYPTFFVNVNRTQANQIGLTERDIANDLLISLSGSFQTAPNYWLNPVNGVNYSIAVQTPQYKIDSLDALKQSPISAGKLAQPQLLENLAPIAAPIPPPSSAITTSSRSTTFASTFRGATSAAWRTTCRNRSTSSSPHPSRCRRACAAYVLVQGRGEHVWPRLFLNQPPPAPADPDSVLPTGSQIHRARPGRQHDLRLHRASDVGILFAIGLVYFLMVVNFQSWLDPFIIIMALPGALAGIRPHALSSPTPRSACPR